MSDPGDAAAGPGSEPTTPAPDTAAPRYRLGCPIWANRDWVGRLFRDNAGPGDFLAQYASVFNTVEGNNTFYGLPAAATVRRWLEQTPPEFRFCFKFPRAISHEAKLLHVQPATREFLQRLTPLRERLGPLFLQLPPSFGPEGLASLVAYLDRLPAGFDYAVEPRHPAFFAKDEPERRFNRALAERGIDRVVLDSRALFSAAPDAADRETVAAQAKKPRVPVRAVALGGRPLVRFIGHPALDANAPFLRPWIDKLAEWIGQNRRPFVFVHTPDNRLAPELGRLLHRLLSERIELPALPEPPAARVVEPAQTTLFG